MTTRKFSGKIFQGPYRWFFHKKEAEKEAQEMREGGMMVRITRAPDPKTGKKGYTLWLRSKARGKR